MKLKHIKILFCATFAIMMLTTAASAQLEVVDTATDADCVRSGNYGMRISTVNGEQQARFVQAGPANGFNNETVFRASFWFNPRSMFIRHGFRHFLLETLPGSPGPGILSPFRVSMFRNQFTGEYKVEMGCRVACANPATCGSAATFPRLVLGTGEAWSQIQVEWAHNSAPGVFDGTCKISIVDGSGAGQSAQANITNAQYQIGFMKMGMIGGIFIDPQSAGSHCYDDFESFRTLAP